MYPPKHLLDTAFRAGYAHGERLGRPILATKQIAELHPEYSGTEQDAFYQGTVDGAAHDPWRLSHLFVSDQADS